MTRCWRWAMPVVIAVSILGAGMSAFGQIHERIYPAPTAPLSLSGLPEGAAFITVTTADDLSLKGIEVAPRPGKPTFLIFHGNGSAASRSVVWLAPLVAEGYGVVAAEYREYSGNPGRASEKGLAADADAFYARARQTAGAGKLIVVGHSLGGGVAFGLAGRQTLDALVTIGTFSSLPAMAPAFARPLLIDRYDNKAAVAKLDEPYFLVHGDADPVVPFVQGETLRAAAVAAHRPGAMFVVQRGGHGPNSATLATILTTVAAKVEAGGDTAPVALPANVTLTPF
ncbi:alpha/beta hydrolase family protein [Caulobacter hibisci]|uniref:Alpha/beta hydrolase n=1 Tax=Caulobacter hibisci TaxID=2035993 RepID=A0ABS0SUQ9_9CAUL|nr:alpha/beta hydrolase [Caulobacter hibisci]MBI1683382.1 alpha/beta hydrolase [Caulobacter hibisci]